MLKFESRNVKTWRFDARIIDRTFLRNTFKLIQLSVLYYIFTFYILLKRETNV